MIRDDVRLGQGVRIHHPDLVNLYGCDIGDECNIGAFVEIRPGVRIGNGVKIQAFAFIPEGVTIEDGVFIGPHVCFTNDRYPRASTEDYTPLPTMVRKGASISANATIVCGIEIGEGALIGAGAVVCKNVPRYEIWAGVPASRISTAPDVQRDVSKSGRGTDDCQ